MLSLTVKLWLTLWQDFSKISLTSLLAKSWNSIVIVKFPFVPSSTHSYDFHFDCFPSVSRKKNRKKKLNKFDWNSWIELPVDCDCEIAAARKDYVVGLGVRQIFGADVVYSDEYVANSQTDIFGDAAFGNLRSKKYRIVTWIFGKFFFKSNFNENSFSHFNKYELKRKI